MHTGETVVVAPRRIVTNLCARRCNALKA